MAGEELPHNLFHEGHAMLQAVLSDFVALQQHQIWTTIDYRVARPRQAAPNVTIIDGRRPYRDTLRQLVKQVDAVLIIAPETGRVLLELSELVEEEKKLLLGSRPPAIRIATYKDLTCEQLTKHGLPTPKTAVARFDQDPFPQAEKVGYPLVVKPMDGAGCSGITLVQYSQELLPAVKALRAETKLDNYLIQQFIPGIHASVSLIAAVTGARPLTLNSQEIHISRHFTYQGGDVPLNHPWRALAFQYATSACSAIPGLRGYVGVDLVLSRLGPVIIEINPRLTTSYIGVRRVIQGNLAQMILAAARDGIVPERIDTTGAVHFTPQAVEETSGGGQH